MVVRELIWPGRDQTAAAPAAAGAAARTPGAPDFVPAGTHPAFTNRFVLLDPKATNFPCRLQRVPPR